MNRASGFVLSIALISLAGGCGSLFKRVDYTAFKESRPKSILVLPPLNNSPDIKGSNSVYSQTTFPLAESGYYVFPVTLVDGILKENGMQTAADAHAISHEKLVEVFGADAALYITVTDYGTKYYVIDSATVVSANAKLVDLRNGALLWEGSATASNQSGGSGGIIESLVTAVVKQIVNTVTDSGYLVAEQATLRLLMAGQHNAILHGPRSPKYKLD